MKFDGTHADVKFFSDLGVRPSSRDCAEHFFLTFCEGLDRLGWCGGGDASREGGEEPTGDPRVDERVVDDAAPARNLKSRLDLAETPGPRTTTGGGLSSIVTVRTPPARSLEFIQRWSTCSIGNSRPGAAANHAFRR
jgi:hypothetical protein